MYPKNIIFVLLLFFSSLLGSIFILLPLFPLFFIRHTLWRYLVDRICGFWIIFPVALLKYFLGIRFTVSGDKIKRNEKAIIIMNHRTRLDWLFFWNALFNIDPLLLTTEKISLKAGLKRIPGAGWAMECNVFMFLDRAWETDEQLMTDLCVYYGWTKNFYQMLVFPEGTDYCEKSVVKSKAFSEKYDLPHHEYVLQPRTTGFVHIVNELLKNNAVDYIYDVTIGYPDKIVQTENDFGMGRDCPQGVDFYVKRYKLSDEIPNVSADNLTRWCREKWDKKNEILRQYYESENEDNLHRFPGNLLTNPDHETNSSVLYIALTFWILSVIVWIYLTLTSYFVMAYVVFGVIFYHSIQHFYGGVEKLSFLYVKNYVM